MQCYAKVESALRQQDEHASLIQVSWFPFPLWCQTRGLATSEKSVVSYTESRPRRDGTHQLEDTNGQDEGSSCGSRIVVLGF
jgi:hypothetical protein